MTILQICDALCTRRHLDNQRPAPRGAWKVIVAQILTFGAIYWALAGVLWLYQAR